LADRRRDNGPAGTLTPVQQAELYDILRAESPDGGLWTGPKVARYVRDRWGVEVVPQTGWRWLNDLGFSLRVPRPRHPKAATPDQQRVWL
jgi:transposase